MVQDAMFAAAFLISLAAYLACGCLFAAPFVWRGAQRLDPHTAKGSRGFRLLIFPGVIAFWPLLLRRWVKGISSPPEEGNAHRCAANRQSP